MFAPSTTTTSLPTTGIPTHQPPAAAEFAMREFLRPDIVELWSYVKELYLGGVGSWGELEIRWLRPRWEALVSPPHTLPTDQPVRAIFEFLPEVQDLSGWSKTVAKRDTKKND
ncbi:hypothetical protein DXG01_014355 [Tephrocybe rancida]|nr:hypothetical protein DXG01_014355 [Tephrocybe rancida]